MIFEKEGYAIKLLSALDKVFANKEPRFYPECTKFTALQGEIISFQVAYYCHKYQTINVKVSSPIADFIRVRAVKCVPSTHPAHPATDDNYLNTEPGLFPDLLSDLDNDIITVTGEQWNALWVDAEITEETGAGVYPVKIELCDPAGETLCKIDTSLKVIAAKLPPQTLIHTEWFHSDCLADYYGVEVFSEEHFAIIENFITAGVKRGINMFLTPLFTPPLDTAVGGARTTVQLIDVTVADGKYSFQFDKLKRWIDMGIRCGVKYFEMSHLFSQWGAIYAPKVMATTDGEYKQIFGWDTSASGSEYAEFLTAFLPLLTEKFKEWNIADKVYFHISDEPALDQLESYTAVKNIVYPFIKDYPIIDALSDYDFYKTGAVAHPIPSSNHIAPFIENEVANLWTYYCTAENLKVSNRFMSMPSLRNRIIGLQWYKFNIKGFLQWGYNFYNSQFSLDHINPYQITDAGGKFPSGDPFLVYPKADGTPEESIRMMVLFDAIQDLRALTLLESLTSRDFVLQLIEGDLGSPITFWEYPKSDYYLLSLRNKVNEEIEKRI